MPTTSLGTHPTAFWRSKYMAHAAISIGVVLLAGLFGWAFLSTYEGRIHSSRHQAERELQAISQLQADGVASWREQRFADAHALVDDVLLAHAVVDWQQDASPEHTQLVQGRLRILQERARYAAVYLTDATGVVQLATDDVSQLKLPAQEQAALQVALTQARVAAVEPRTDPTFAFPFFSVVAPLFDGATPLGAVWLVSDVRSTLYPLLGQWPTGSATAESSIVTQEVDEVVYLSPLRHADKSGPGMRVVLTRAKDPAVQAIQGARGIFAGEDYRSEPVIAVAATVLDSPWLLVTKVDQAEVLADVRQREMVALGLPLALGLMLIGVLFALWQRKAWLRERDLTTKLEHNMRLLEGAQKAAHIGYFAYDMAHRQFIMSRMADAIFGVQGESGLDRSHWVALLLPQDREHVLAEHAKAIQHATPLRVQYRIRRGNDQELRWVEVWGEFETDPTTGRSTRMFGTAQDITERKQVEEELARYRQGLEQTVRLDPLTQIANRRALDEHVDSEWQRAMRSQTMLGMLMIDVDHFKAYNDHHGHVAGDHCLQDVARTIAASVGRAGELAARFGGEEFAVLIPDATPAHVRHVAQRICDAVQALGVPHGHSPTADCITVSVGVTCVRPVFNEPVAVEHMFKQADDALYQAKQAGRNCTREFASA
jgi:diguanylate cyclase (GGDEF)-like protein/PAS domain S-box-containing protein